MNLEQTIAKQRDRIDELEETLRQFKESISPAKALFPMSWRLTPAQHRLMAAFSKTPFLSYEKCFLAMTLNREVEADNLVKVQIAKLRKKIEPLGLKIMTRWGYGYEMTEESAAKVRAVLAPT